MAYKRSKTDGALYCPYCGHGFNMTRDRYWAVYDARKRGDVYAITTCKYCNKEFKFMNVTPTFVRNTGIRAVLKMEALI